MIMVHGTVEVVVKTKPEYNSSGYTLIGRYTGGSITATNNPSTGVGSCLTFQKGKFARNIRLSIDGNPKNWNENRWQYHWETTRTENEKIYASSIVKYTEESVGNYTTESKVIKNGIIMQKTVDANLRVAVSQNAGAFDVGSSNYCIHDDIHTVRAYNRGLSTEEALNNWYIDLYRFKE